MVLFSFSLSLPLFVSLSVVLSVFRSPSLSLSSSLSHSFYLFMRFYQSMIAYLISSAVFHCAQIIRMLQLKQQTVIKDIVIFHDAFGESVCLSIYMGRLELSARAVGMIGMISLSCKRGLLWLRHEPLQSLALRFGTNSF